MKISVNGTPRDVADTTTVGALLVTMSGGGRGSAAVVDGEVVPRSRWDEQRLSAGAVVEVITAVQGG